MYRELRRDVSRKLDLTRLVDDRDNDRRFGYARFDTRIRAEVARERIPISYSSLGVERKGKLYWPLAPRNLAILIAWLRPKSWHWSGTEYVE